MNLMAGPVAAGRGTEGCVRPEAARGSSWLPSGAWTWPEMGKDAPRGHDVEPEGRRVASERLEAAYYEQRWAEGVGCCGAGVAEGGARRLHASESVSGIGVGRGHVDAEERETEGRALERQRTRVIGAVAEMGTGAWGSSDGFWSRAQDGRDVRAVGPRGRVWRMKETGITESQTATDWLDAGLVSSLSSQEPPLALALISSNQCSSMSPDFDPPSSPSQSSAPSSSSASTSSSSSLSLPLSLDQMALHPHDPAVPASPRDVADAPFYSKLDMMPERIDEDAVMMDWDEDNASDESSGESRGRDFYPIFVALCSHRNVCASRVPQAVSVSVSVSVSVCTYVSVRVARTSQRARVRWAVWHAWVAGREGRGWALRGGESRDASGMAVPVAKTTRGCVIPRALAEKKGGGSSRD